MKHHIPATAIEFQPDAEEIRSQRLPRLAVFTVLGSFVLMMVLVIFASIHKVDIMIPARGHLVTDVPDIVMKPLQLSVIKDIHVKVGQVVKKDQILFTFDPTSIRAELEKTQNEIATLQAQYDRLKAEFENRPFTVDGKADQPHLWQASIYRTRQDYFRQRINYFDASVRQLDATAKSEQDSLDKQKERLALSQKIEDMYTIMKSENVAALKELLQVSISRMALESTVDTLSNNLLELRHQRESTLASKNSFIQDWNKTLAEELVNVERELIYNQKAAEKYQNLVSYVSLRAPCDAVVHEIAAFSVGSAVREAEALITLVPLNGRLELEAEIRPQDIGKVNPGADVRIKLNAYPFQKFGTVPGQVRVISENTLQRRTRPADELDTMTYFRAQIALTGSLKNPPEHFRLIPGMEADAEIRVGQRRLIEFLIYPLLKGLEFYKN
ncbi:MAG: HlyD family type I secretion periplasmic adaptor subunit [Lentisphaeria bacterium]|nr:HlyD family type I secretion periplasmic adaptor subunit [Lentisphaeria bacterium]